MICLLMPPQVNIGLRGFFIRFIESSIFYLQEMLQNTDAFTTATAFLIAEESAIFMEIGAKHRILSIISLIIGW